MSPDLDNISDEELVLLALDDQNNFLYIIKRYKSKLFSYIRRISDVEAEDAEDILQVVFLKVYQNLNDFDSSLKFSSWIYRIAHNEVINSYRKRMARPQKAYADEDNNILNNIVADFDLEREVNLKFLRQNIMDVLENIDPKYREVIVLKFFEEKSYEEISDIIKKPMGTVASLMSRAKKEFCKEFQKQDIKY